MFIYYLLNWYRESRYNIFLSDSQWLWQDYIPRRHIFYTPATERLLMTEIKKIESSSWQTCLVDASSFNKLSWREWYINTEPNDSLKCVFPSQNGSQFNPNLFTQQSKPTSPKKWWPNCITQHLDPNFNLKRLGTQTIGLKQLPSENQTWHWNTPIKMQVFMEINPKKWWISMAMFDFPSCYSHLPVVTGYKKDYTFYKWAYTYL